MTAVQLALCDSTWIDLTPQPRRRRGKKITGSEQRDLHGQGLAPSQIKHIRTIRLASQEYL